MRVVFMGTPDFAVPALEALCSSGYEVTLVVTQPDKPQGRKRVLTPPVVKAYALANAIPVYQPQSLKTDEAYERILSESPDCIVVAAYGKILPQRVLDIPRYGCVNIHGSLLPQYRGAAPIQWSILNGETQTGVTTMLMAAGLDTGDILLQQKTAIGDEETAGELFDRLAKLGASLLLQTLTALQNNAVQPVRQEEAKASYVSVLTKEAAGIDWSNSARHIHNQVRGMNPWPVAQTRCTEKMLKIYTCTVSDSDFGETNGEVTVHDDEIFVRCGDGICLKIQSLQLEGSKRMEAAEFLRGRSFAPGQVLGC